MAGLDIAGGVTGKSGYHLREVVPATHTLIAVMVDAAVANILTIFHNIEDGAGKVVSIGRSARLVEDHLELGFRSCQVEHGLHKIPTKLGVEPGRADDDMVHAGDLYLLLAVQLGQTINARRSALLVFLAGHIVGVAAKDVVGAYVHEQSILLFHHFGQILWGNGIESLDDITGSLGSIHIGPRRTVDNAFHVVFPHHSADSIDVGDVQLLVTITHIGEDIMIFTVPGNDLHFVAQLAVGTGNQYIHRYLKL